MNPLETTNQIQTESISKPVQPLCHWILRGQTLMVKNRVLQVTNCQVVFHPETLSKRTSEDVVELVNFWFEQPVEGSVLYSFNESTGDMEPVKNPLEILDTNKRWLVQFDGNVSRSIRNLYKQHYKPVPAA